MTNLLSNIPGGGEVSKGATFSPCRKYRYTLHRIWNTDLPLLTVIGLNPSTADERIDDPTVKRCIRFARDWEMGGLWMLNAFAFRATDPKDMFAAKEPVGQDNDRSIVEVCKKAGNIIAAWGTHGGYLDRDREVMDLLERRVSQAVFCLGVTKEGFPKHPLYLPANAQPIPYEGRQ